MASQWEQIQQNSAAFDQITQLYHEKGEFFPFEIRHFLAPFIEDPKW